MMMTQLVFCIYLLQDCPSYNDFEIFASICLLVHGGLFVGAAFNITVSYHKY